MLAPGMVASGLRSSDSGEKDRLILADQTQFLLHGAVHADSGHDVGIAEQPLLGVMKETDCTTAVATGLGKLVANTPDTK